MNNNNQSFQEKVYPWTVKCFGAQIAKDTSERNYRFLEESLELLQSLGGDKESVLKVVDYIFQREKGEPKQEMGGVMVTLAALANANNININECAETELERCWSKIDKIREKHKKKPKFLKGNHEIQL